MKVKHLQKAGALLVGIHSCSEADKVMPVLTVFSLCLLSHKKVRKANCQENCKETMIIKHLQKAEALLAGIHSCSEADKAMLMVTVCYM